MAMSESRLTFVRLLLLLFSDWVAAAEARLASMGLTLLTTHTAEIVARLKYILSRRKQ